MYFKFTHFFFAETNPPNSDGLRQGDKLKKNDKRQSQIEKKTSSPVQLPLNSNSTYLCHSARQLPYLTTKS